MSHRIMIRMKQALGDTIALSALVRDLNVTYPNTYRLTMDTHFRSLWVGNPHAYPAAGNEKHQQVVELSYTAAVVESRDAKPVHLIRGFCDDFRRKTGIPVAPLQPKGVVYLNDAEMRPLIDGRYWVILAGGKLDRTVKHWYFNRHQQLVDRLAHFGVRCVQAGTPAHSHVHPPLRNVLNAVGKTEDPRDLCGLIANADGVICGITSGLHIAAAFDKPCVVIAGGSEEPWFYGYHNGYHEKAFGAQCAKVAMEQQILHTMGLLYCCGKEACWKRRTVPIEPIDHTRNKGRMCLEPVRVDGEQPVARCLEMITVDHVIEALFSYYEAGLIPPISKPKGTYSLPPADDTPTYVPLPALPVLPPLQFMRSANLPAREPDVRRMAAPLELKTDKPMVTGGVFDNPIIGGKFTVCVLCYGEHPDLAKRCLNSILATVPSARIDLRVAANAVCNETLRYLNDQPINRLYINSENRLKYPVMRDMFRDPQHPLETNYVIWFDDDSYVVDPKWLVKMSEEIVANHVNGCRMFGHKYYHDTNIFAKGGHNPTTWFKEAPWWRDRQFKVRGVMREAPNGSMIEFIPGSFWALHVPTMLAADIPDQRLLHRGGDIAIGMQLHQTGFKIHSCNGKNSLVYMTGAKRRGFDEDLPWSHKRKFKSLAV